MREKRKILIVDDSEMNRLLLSDMNPPDCRKRRPSRCQQTGQPGNLLYPGQRLCSVYRPGRGGKSAGKRKVCDERGGRSRRTSRDNPLYDRSAQRAESCNGTSRVCNRNPAGKRRGRYRGSGGCFRRDASVRQFEFHGNGRPGGTKRSTGQNTICPSGRAVSD